MTMLSNIPRYSPSARQRRKYPAGLLAWLGRVINHLVAAAIARQERHAALIALRRFSDRELQDIGISRYEIEGGLDEAGRTRARLQRLER